MTVPSGRSALMFTFVSFSEDDFLGEVLAWLTHVPLAFFIIEASMVIAVPFSRCERFTAFLVLLGQLLNEIMSNLLKDYFQEPRPSGTERYDYGMPSSHSQFMGCLLGLFSHLLELTIFRYLPRWLAYLLAYAGSALICFSRFYLKYHNPRQVLAGFFIGLIWGSLWSKVIDGVRSPRKIKDV